MFLGPRYVLLENFYLSILKFFIFHIHAADCHITCWQFTYQVDSHHMLHHVNVHPALLLVVVDYSGFFSHIELKPMLTL